MTVLHVRDVVRVCQDRINGSGSVYTAQAFGQPGQTVNVYGSAFDPELQRWVLIATLTCDAEGMASVVWQGTWPFLRTQGTAEVAIARGCL